MRRLTLTVLCGAYLSMGLATATEVTTDTLVKWIESGSPAQRVEARQLLHRAGVEALPALLPLLEHADPEAAWAALRVVEDIVNEAGSPGREAGRRVAAEQIMTLVAPQQSAAMKKLGLRLLPLAVPEDFDVSPVAALLADPDLREKARRSLHHMGTDNAAKALLSAIEGAEPAFQAALLNGLALLAYAPGRERFQALTHAEDAAVRAAAARALSWTGDPSYLADLRRVHSQADEATAFEAADALLRLAEAMAQRGGNWDVALSIFGELLAKETGAVPRSGAISGLGRYGDESAVALILAAVEGPEGAGLEGPAILAIGQLEGRGATRAMLAAYPNLPEALQLNMLSVLGKRGDPECAALLSEMARTGAGAFRDAAARALGNSDDPVALEGLAAYAASQQGEARAATVANLARLAENLGARGVQDGAGKAYLALYHLAENDEQRSRALAGIKEFPTPEALEVILEGIEDDDIGTLPVGLMAGLTRALFAEDRKDEAERVLAMLLARLQGPTDVKEALRYLDGAPGFSLYDHFGVVRTWWLVAPLPWSKAEGFTAPPVDPKAIDLEIPVEQDGASLPWNRHDVGDPGGMVPLAGVVGLVNDVCAYGYTTVNLPETVEGQIRAGSDDGLRIWLNGEVVHENNIDRGADFDQDIVPVTFRAGENEILVQCTQNSGGWAMTMRLTKTNGAPLLTM